MTTLHVSEDALRRAVRGFPSVAGLEVDADPPRKLTIVVRERRPVAVLAAGTQRVPATGDGRLLRGLRTGPLPTVSVRAVPPGDRVTDRRALDALAIAAAAPAALRPRLTEIARGTRGLELELRDGPALVFGSQGRARAKWAAAARVLAEPDVAGATYLDLRLPERVAAGGLAPIATPQPQPQPVPERG
jgi:cell division protein FtsQ